VGRRGISEPGERFAKREITTWKSEAKGEAKKLYLKCLIPTRVGSTDRSR